MIFRAVTKLENEKNVKFATLCVKLDHNSYKNIICKFKFSRNFNFSLDWTLRIAKGNSTTVFNLEETLLELFIAYLYRILY